MDFRKVGSDIVTVSWSLFKIMIPTLLVVKLCQDIGADMWLADLMRPIMGVMSLPAELAIILTTTMLTNPYAGIIVAASIPEMANLNVGQMSILALFMLFAHSLPVEVLISRRAGVRARITLAVRVGGGILACIILAQIFKMTGWYSKPASMHIPQITIDNSWSGWLQGQLISLVIIQVVIIALLFFLEILRLIGVEKLMRILLAPFLRSMKIGERASTIAIVGVTLGLGFGGGLLIKDVETGEIPKEDVFGILCFINLLHSVFEDTAIVMLLGPSLFIVLGFRFLFSFVLIYIIMLCVQKMPQHIWHTQLTNKYIPQNAGAA